MAFPATSSSTHVEAELIRLACADTNGLAGRWRVLFGGRAPDLPRALLLRILAYRIQADAAGDLDPTTIRLLDRLGRGEIADQRRRRRSDQPAAAPTLWTRGREILVPGSEPDLRPR